MPNASIEEQNTVTTREAIQIADEPLPVGAAPMSSCELELDVHDRTYKPETYPGDKGTAVVVEALTVEDVTGEVVTAAVLCNGGAAIEDVAGAQGGKPAHSSKASGEGPSQQSRRDASGHLYTEHVLTQ
mmetsp:Transcript_13385/g.36747  ORF Transcript_13385/g.36747 Transcript_13385/m.36747 type:complete len:129 (+) Transcript_13385:1043-1429(+)